MLVQESGMLLVPTSSHTSSLASSFELCTLSFGLGCSFFVFKWFWKIAVTEESTWDTRLLSVAQEYTNPPSEVKTLAIYKTAHQRNKYVRAEKVSNDFEKLLPS